jgi:hypothetical protein
MEKNKMSSIHEALKKPSLAAALALSVIHMIASTGCMEDRIAGSTSTGNTGKGTISGRVLDAQGNGVANAKVRVLAVDHNPGPVGAGSTDIADVAVTGTDGSFRTDSLADGRYNLLGDKDGNLSFRDSVAVLGDSATEVAGDTLKPPGAVTGVVRLRPGHDSRTVFLILMGTTTLGLPVDSIGNFRLGNLAEGSYRLRLLSTLDDYKPLDTTIAVRSGRHDTLPDTLRLTYVEPPAGGGIPVIDGVAISYDSTAMAATLSWKRQDPAKVGSYNVYRKHRDSAFVKLNKVPLPDTFLVDDWKSGLVPGQIYHYAVAALDPQGNEGRKGEAAVVVIGKRYTVDEAVPGSDCGAGTCQYDVDTAGNVWVAEWSGTVVRYGAGGPTKWIDSNTPNTLQPQIKLDRAGGVNLLYRQPLRVAKYDAAGVLQWITPIPTERDVAFNLHVGGDTVYVWGYEERVMTAIGKTGNIIARDTLLKAYAPPTGLSSPYFKPEIGFFTNTFDGIHLHDRQGRTTETWNPEAREYLRDLTRDKAGRWYVSWSKGIVDVFGPDRRLLGSILVGGTGYLIHRNGFLYMQTFPGHKTLKIATGF